MNKKKTIEQRIEALEDFCDFLVDHLQEIREDLNSDAIALNRIEDFINAVTERRTVEH